MGFGRCSIQVLYIADAPLVQLPCWKVVDSFESIDPEEIQWAAGLPVPDNDTNCGCGKGDARMHECDCNEKHVFVCETTDFHSK